MKRTRNNDGQYSRDRSPKILLEEMERGEIYSTKNLADAVNIPQRTALRYLNELAEKGRVEKQMLNEKTAMWARYE